MENLHLLSVLVDILQETKQVLEAEIFSLREELPREGVDQLRVKNEIREKESRLAMISEDAIE